jgi:hypothetical protein
LDDEYDAMPRPPMSDAMDDTTTKFSIGMPVENSCSHHAPLALQSATS